MLLLAYTGFAQINVDSLLQAQPPSKIDVIAKARAMLIDAFMAGDKQKVQELHSYIAEKFEHDEYIALFPAEQELLFAWYGDFESLVAYIQKADSAYFAQLSKKIMPPYTNNFYQTLEGHVQQSFESILSSLQASPLTQEEKDFVAIFLQYFWLTDEDIRYYAYSPYYMNTQLYSVVGVRHDRVDSLIRPINIATRKFIAAYPASTYIKSLSSYELKPSDWGLGFAVNFGYAAKTGDFSKSFKNDGNFDFNIDVAYQKYIATMGIMATFGNARKDIVKSSSLVLPKDTITKIYNLYWSLGYRFFDDKRIIITPMLGIGTTWINPGTTAGRKHDPVLKDFDYSYGLTTNFGVAADIRLGKIRKVVGQDFVRPSYTALRLGYKFSLNNISKHAPTFYDGNLHTVTVGIYFFGRSVKPVRYK